MDFQNIGLIARYEMKTLSREWSFKMVTFSSVLIVTFLTLLTQSNLVEPQWVAISLPSAIPYANAWLVNTLQMIMVIFFAGNFLGGKHLVGSNSSLAARPYSNLELLWGKTTGFLVLMLCSSLLLGTIALFIHLLASDSPFAFYPYLFYFLTLTCPVLFFFTGLTICVKGIARHPALASILLLVMLYFFLGPGSESLHGAFDVLAISLPNTFSDITGFAGLWFYLLQRSCFLAWGIGLITLGMSFINRLPSGTKSNLVAVKRGSCFLVLGFLLSGFYTGEMVRRDGERKAVREVFSKYQRVPQVSVTDHDIEFKHEGYSYSASSKLRLVNRNERRVDSVILYLNPGLDVTGLTTGGEPLTFRRELQVLILPLSMGAGETRELDMAYGGSISAAVCYPEVVDIDSLAKVHRYYMYNMGQNYFYLQPDYTLLTPECSWYPTGKPVGYVNSPYLSDQDYTRFQLVVRGEAGGVVISQGKETREGGDTRFENEVALPGLTLCAGGYTRASTRKGDVLYEVFLFKGHEYLLPGEIGSGEAIEHWESMCWSKYKSRNPEAYVFDKLNMVEVPVHFRAYGRDWKDRSERVQPEMILRPEREALFPRAFRVSNESNGPGSTPELQFLSMYQRYLVDGTWNVPVGNLFFSQLTGKRKRREVRNDSDVSFLCQKYHYNVYSPEFVGINLLFNAMQDGFLANFDDEGNGYSMIDYLEDGSLEDALRDPGDEINPGDVLFSKGYHFFKHVLREVPPEEFERFNTFFLQSHAFQSFSYEEYCEEVEGEFGVSLLDLTRALYKERGLPAYYFREARLDDVESPDGKRGEVFSIKAWNKGKVDGFLSLRDTRRGGKRRHYFIPAGSCKEVKVYLEGNGDDCHVELLTNLSLNKPTYYYFEDFPERGIVREAVDGIFDSDTLPFAPEPGVYIVDNDDPGCRVVEDSRGVDKLRRQYKYKNSRWNRLDSDNAYGELAKSFLEKMFEVGNSDVEWEVNLPEAGRYELFVYNNKPRVELGYSMSLGASRQKERESPVQRYRFTRAGEEKEVEVSLLDEEHGWVSLGVYEFHGGKAKVTLSGQGIDKYQYMYADAVKWVKVK